MIARRLLSAPVAAFTAALCLASGAQVSITSPPAGEAVAGTVVVTADVVGVGDISRVEFHVDGRVAGSIAAPPWELAVETGPENVAHRFEVIVITPAGVAVRASLVTPRIEVDEEVSVQLQQLYVTASRGGRRVLGLDRADFVVLDNGVSQSLVTFERGDVPFTAVVLLDSSSSMEGEKMRAALDGARSFVDTMRPLDEARLVAFSDRPLGATRFLAGGEPPAAAFFAVEATGGTALNDHLYAALHVLEQRQGRRVVVMLSDGLDSHSVLSIDDVLPLVDRSRALLYWVRLVAGAPGAPDLAPGRQHTAWRDGRGHRRQIEMLERAVERSGGRVAMIRGAADVAPTFAEILAELREQYVLGYYPSQARDDGAWHNVKVKTKLAGLDLRASSGYLDF